MNKPLGLETEHLSHQGPSWGPGGGCSFTGDSERQLGLCKWRISLYGRSIRGNWRGAPIMGTLKDMKMGLEMGLSCNRGPVGEP